MFCTRCGVELHDDDCFCSRCGTRTGVGRPAAEPRRLMLDKRNKKIAGVCAGVARYLDVDVNLVRIIWLVIAICTGGMGFIAYLGAWLILPSDHGADPTTAIAQQPQTAN
jgi:phage shock protein C